MRTATSTLPLALLCAVSLGLLACEKAKPPTDNPSTTSGGEVTNPDASSDGGGEEAGGDEAGSGDDGGGEVAWADMSRDQRLTHMGTVVMPAMKDKFMQQGFDTFKCANCHGADYKEVDFKMPNDLTPLNPDNPIQSGMDLDEEMTKFMVSVVLPEMATMLGKETDVTTGKGEFGCLSCHLSE